MISNTAIRATPPEMLGTTNDFSAFATLRVRHKQESDLRQGSWGLTAIPGFEDEHGPLPTAGSCRLHDRHQRRQPRPEPRVFRDADSSRRHRLDAMNSVTIRQE